MSLLDLLWAKKNTKPAANEIPALSYYQIIEKEIKPLETVTVDFAVALKTVKEKEDRIEVLTALVDSFYAIKEKCRVLGPDFQRYFSENWEHCHNSRNPDFCYVDRYEAELRELKKE